MKYSLILIISLFTGVTNASDINCQGKVTYVMDYPNQCNGNMSFKTTGSKGIWVCPPSDKGNSLLLTAFATGKEIGVYINDQGGTITCETLPQYVPARYILINQ